MLIGYIVSFVAHVIAWTTYNVECSTMLWDLSNRDVIYTVTRWYRALIAFKQMLYWKRKPCHLAFVSLLALPFLRFLLLLLPSLLNTWTWKHLLLSSSQVSKSRKECASETWDITNPCCEHSLASRTELMPFKCICSHLCCFSRFESCIHDICCFLGEDPSNESQISQICMILSSDSAWSSCSLALRISSCLSQANAVKILLHDSDDMWLHGAETSW